MCIISPAVEKVARALARSSGYGEDVPIHPGEPQIVTIDGQVGWVVPYAGPNWDDASTPLWYLFANQAKLLLADIEAQRILHLTDEELLNESSPEEIASAAAVVESFKASIGI